MGVSALRLQGLTSCGHKIPSWIVRPGDVHLNGDAFDDFVTLFRC
jgi:hypothetical protein